jgi:hypothetical protein
MSNIEAITKLFKEGDIWFAGTDRRKEEWWEDERRRNETQDSETRKNVAEAGCEATLDHQCSALDHQRSALYHQRGALCRKQESGDEDCFGALRELSKERLLITPREKPIAPFFIPEIDQHLPSGGVSFGATHDWFYLPPENTNPREVPALCTVPAILCGNAFKHTAQKAADRKFYCEKILLWVGKRCWPTPYILEENLKFVHNGQRINLLPNCLFIDPPNKKLKNWAIEAALKSGAAATIVADCPFLNLIEAKRFLFAARSGNALALLIRNRSEMSLPSPAASAWGIAPIPSPSFNPRWRLSLLKAKGSRSSRSEWILEAGNPSEDNNYEKISLHIPSELVDRPYQEISGSQRRRA